MKLKLPLPLPRLRAKADRLFSLKRRQEEADSMGYVFCITCNSNVKLQWQEVDAGHFVQREHLATRYEKNNVWPQCRSCNRFKGGRHSIFRDNLIKIIGREQVEWLERKKYDTVISARSLYEKVIEESKTKKGEI